MTTKSREKLIKEMNAIGFVGVNGGILQQVAKTGELPRTTDLEAALKSMASEILYHRLHAKLYGG